MDEDLILQNLVKSFYGGSLKLMLQSEDVKLMTWNWQQKFLDVTLNNTLIKKYPMSKQFTRLFIKKIINYLEGQQEIHDDFYSHLCLTMNSGGKDDSFCYRHYLINSQKEIITIMETNKMVVNGTTGMRTWEAALMLADWALYHRETFANKNILELGSGIGFTGITIGKLCQPKCIYLSDCHSDVLKAICNNIKINFPELQVDTHSKSTATNFFKNRDKVVVAMHLDWNNFEDLPDVTPDVVIGADIVYDPTILQPLCKVLEVLFNRNNQIEVYIASIIRNEETFQSFLKYLGNMNFSYQKLPMDKNVFIEWDQTVEKCLLKIRFQTN